VTLSTDLTAPSAFQANEIHVWRTELGDDGRRAAHRALRSVLGRYLEQNPRRVELRFGRHGKPALADHRAALRFNLSHSGETMLIAIAWRQEIGVDIEQIKPRSDVVALSRRALEPAEAAAVEATAPAARLEAFYAAWTRREAVGKCFGAGLAAPLPQRGFAVGTIDAGPGFAAAIAVAGDALPPLCYFEAEQTLAGWAAST
jgi:4'-phosphopantetheinyl transferase